VRGGINGKPAAQEERRFAAHVVPDAVAEAALAERCGSSSRPAPTPTATPPPPPPLPAPPPPRTPTPRPLPPRRAPRRRPASLRVLRLRHLHLPPRPRGTLHSTPLPSAPLSRSPLLSSPHHVVAPTPLISPLPIRFSRSHLSREIHALTPNAPPRMWRPRTAR
jgi:hypothetical protein